MSLFLALLAQADAEKTTTVAEEAAAASLDLRIEVLLQHLLAACVFSLVGVCVLAIAIWAMTKIVPFSMRKEIEEDQNVALGIIVGAIIIGISIIIAASVIG